MQDWSISSALAMEILQSWAKPSKYSHTINQVDNTELRSDLELTKDTPYLPLTGELCSDFLNYFGEKCLFYKEVQLYNICSVPYSPDVTVFCLIGVILTTGTATPCFCSVSMMAAIWAWWCSPWWSSLIWRLEISSWLERTSWKKKYIYSNNDTLW